MLRTAVLLTTHLTMLGIGVGLTLITLHARRQSLLVRERVLDTHEMFLKGRADQLRRGAFVDEEREPTPKLSPTIVDQHIGGRHRAREERPAAAPVPPPPPRTVNLAAPPRPFVVPEPPVLLKAGLHEATAYLAQQRALREQEKRVFIDIMTNIAKARAWHQGTAPAPRVPAGATS